MVHFHQKRYKESKKSFEKVIRVKTDMYPAYYWLGITLELLGDYDGAVKCFETGVKIKPYSEEPWHWLDQIHRSHGQENAAERATKKVIKLGEGKTEVNPEDAITLSRMAISYANIGENEKALNAANKVMEIDPTDGVILYNCTCAYSCLGKKKEAFTCLKKALERGVVNMLDWIEQIDPYVDSIRKDPEFQKILTEYSEKRK
jgi:tetratricopeptide (TPR) repeat protein